MFIPDKTPRDTRSIFKSSKFYKQNLVVVKITSKWNIMQWHKIVSNKFCTRIFQVHRVDGPRLDLFSPITNKELSAIAKLSERNEELVSFQDWTEVH